MDILRFSIILLLVIGLVPLASAEDIVHTHSLSGTPDDYNGNEFVCGGQVTDVVTSTSNEGVGMWFLWYKDGAESESQLSYTSNYPYRDNLYDSQSGSWEIEVDEVSRETYQDNDQQIKLHTTWLASSSESFTVASAPEFTFGSLIAMFLAGAIYLMIRRNLDGSTNANR